MVTARNSTNSTARHGTARHDTVHPSAQISPSFATGLPEDLATSLCDVTLLVMEVEQVTKRCLNNDLNHMNRSPRVFVIIVAAAIS